MQRFALLFSVVLMLFATGMQAHSQTREDRLGLARIHLLKAFHKLQIEADSETTARIVINDLVEQGHVISEAQAAEIVSLFQSVMSNEARKMMLSFDEILADFFTFDELMAIQTNDPTARGDDARRRLALIMGQNSALILAHATTRFPDLQPSIEFILNSPPPEDAAIDPNKEDAAASDSTEVDK